jgi:hypothetical protein
MAVNDRIEILSDDINYQQKAQAGRLEFTPGKAHSKPLDENWPKDFNLKVGESYPDTQEDQRSRVALLKRNTVCDTTIPEPEVLSTETRKGIDVDQMYSGSYTYTNTKTQKNDGKQERGTGYNGVKP